MKDGKVFRTRKSDGLRYVVMEPTAGCRHYPARWVKPKGSYLRGSTDDLTTGAWQDFEIAFTPAKDGVVTLHVRGRPYASAADNKLLPVWVYFDDLAVQGAELSNPSFEELDAKGIPTGWRRYTPSHTTLLPHVIEGEGSARSGRRCVKVWYSAGFSQELRVEEGKQVTVRARVRGEVQRNPG